MISWTISNCQTGSKEIHLVLEKAIALPLPFLYEMGLRVVSDLVLEIPVRSEASMTVELALGKMGTKGQLHGNGKGQVAWELSVSVAHYSMN